MAAVRSASFSCSGWTSARRRFVRVVVEEWEAAPGGVFAPVRPDTSIAGKGPGKAPKAAHRRVLPYRRPSPKRAVVESMGDRLEKVTLT